MFERAKYKDSNKKSWSDISNPAATKKYDGSHFFMPVQEDGSLRYFSRRESVKGHFPERTSQLPHLSEKKLPQFAGNVYSVELIHTGHDHNASEKHTKLSGILNSLAPRAIATQKETGPVRAVLIDVINPVFPTYAEKLAHMKEVEKEFGNSKLMFVPKVETTKAGIVKLIDQTRAKGEEGVIVASLTDPEHSNTRVKIKHFLTHNLKITKVLQEFDKNGKPKDSMGAVEVSDRSGRVVALVGSGWTREQRISAWKNPYTVLNTMIQVSSLGTSGPGGRLRHPVYNGEPDGDWDLIE